MTSPELVSTVIPTFNRREMVCRAVNSALAQTYPAQEIIVVDDGSTDGTAQMLRDQYGDRVICVSQANAGVSRARNCGVRMARGSLIALLDSDDEWKSDKLTKQVDFLDRHPDIDMVLCDVQRVDRHRRPINVFRRREVIRNDGDVLLDLLANPSLVPASVLMRRGVYTALSGFDESLRTAEDIDFHLRAALRFRIGVIDEALTIAMRGHDGLSSDPQSDSDYVRVIEHFVTTYSSRIPRPIGRQTLFSTYCRNSRSSIVSGRLSQGWKYWTKAFTNAGSLHNVSTLAALLAVFGITISVSAARSLGIK
ncbi:MAG: glycosyltransferase [Pseudomonadota bacterium]